MGRKKSTKILLKPVFNKKYNVYNLCRRFLNVTGYYKDFKFVGVQNTFLN